jgi:zinc and cadmium transporter
MEAFIAACCVALLSLSGIMLFGRTSHRLVGEGIFLPLSIGAFLGVTFFELLPETFEMTEWASLSVAAGFMGFFVLSRLISEYHHHHHTGEGHTHVHARGSLILLGDAVHNLADGVVIAASFFVSPALGIATTIGIALHEVPQEIAELSILMHSGYSRTKALVWNMISALTIVVGVILTNSFATFFESSVGILIGIVAGNLLYIAASDLLPTLSETRNSRTTFVRQSGLVLIGLSGIASLLSFTH